MKKLVPVLMIVFILAISNHFYSKKSRVVVTPFPQQFIDDRTNFIQSVTTLNESSELTQPKDNDLAFTLSKEQEKLIYSKIEEGIALSAKVDDAFLDYMHPDLKEYYRNKLIAGTEVYYEGIKANNNGDEVAGFQKQMKGNNLMRQWWNWWDSHNDDLAEKAYPNK